jgi:drug/metabolite transporter (DMT)-like permease
MIVGLGAVVGLFRLQLRQLIGLGLGFIGTVILIGGGTMLLSFTGIGLALLSGLSWALYCVFSPEMAYELCRRASPRLRTTHSLSVPFCIWDLSLLSCRVLVA